MLHTFPRDGLMEIQEVAGVMGEWARERERNFLGVNSTVEKSHKVGTFIGFRTALKLCELCKCLASSK